MAAIMPSLLLIGLALARTLTFLIIALVSLKGTQPAQRPAILRALAALRSRTISDRVVTDANARSRAPRNNTAR
jgi:hypothetical protein